MSEQQTLPQPKSKTESHAVIDIQKAFYQGDIPREAAISASTILFDISQTDAHKLFPFVGDITRLRVKTPIVIAASLLGCCVGFILGKWVGSFVQPMMPHLNSATVQALTSTIGVFLGAVFAVLGTFAWYKHAEKP